MSTPRTKIKWQLHNYCRAECSYCPTEIRGGEEPRHINEFTALVKKINSWYNNMGRVTDWVFDGGEVLDTDYFPGLIKECKQGGGTVEITTNGGRLWIDWWAIEPHVDRLNLTYHYWQQHSLIEFVIGLFLKQNKSFAVSVPMRPDFFDEDLDRALRLEEKFNINVGKAALYKNARVELGMYDYTDDQIRIMLGEDFLINYRTPKLPKSPEEKIVEVYHKNDNKFTGQLCNLGIEMLVIAYNGWARGANCKNDSLGFVWEETWTPPSTPQHCTMIACIHQEDQKITKFP